VAGVVVAEPAGVVAAGLVPVGALFVPLSLVDPQAAAPKHNVAARTTGAKRRSAP
jgi:hypothetical protein